MLEGHNKELLYFTWAEPNSANKAHVKFSIWPNWFQLILFGSAEAFFMPGQPSFGLAHECEVQCLTRALSAEIVI